MDNSGILQLFTQHQWNVLMTWYSSLTTIVGGLLILSLVRSGYREMLSGVSGDGNPAARAAFMEGVRRVFIAMACMMLAPTFIYLLVAVNDAVVAFIAQILNNYTFETKFQLKRALDPAGMFEKILLPIPTMILELLHKVLDLKSVSELIYNGNLNCLKNQLLDLAGNTGLNTGNELANVLVRLAFIGFDVYFNAVFTIRKWVIAANIAVAPIVFWVWAIFAERTIIEIWIAEVIETVFKQMFYALTLAVFLSLVSAKTSPVVSGGWLATQLKDLGVWLAGFGGAVAVLILVYLGFKLATAESPEKAAEAKTGVRKVFIGLAVLGLVVPIGGFLASVLSGDWGVSGLSFNGKNKAVTAWDAFWMFFTVIPVARAFSSMFKSLVARFGTIEEENLAKMGFGALAAVTSTITRTASRKYLLGGAGSGIGSGVTGSGIVSSGAVTDMGGVPTGTINMGLENNPDMYEERKKVTRGPDGGYAEMTWRVPKPEISGLQKAARTASAKGILPARAMAAAGSASSVGVPELAPAMSGLFGAVGRVVSTVPAMVKQTAADFKGTVIGENESIRDFLKDTSVKDFLKSTGDFLEKYTGAKTKLGGIAAIAAATGGTVFGPDVALAAQKGTLAVENGVLKARDLAVPAGRFVKDRGSLVINKAEDFIINWKK